MTSQAVLSRPADLRRAAMLVACLGGSAAAQPASRPPLGARVRLETPDGRRVTGRVLSIEADTIVLRLQLQTDTGAFVLSQFRAYALSAGPDRGRGVRNGALVGGVLGAAAIALGVYTDATTHTDVMIPATVIALPAAAGLVIVGAGIGALAGPERWGPTMPLRVGMGPERHREAAGVMTVGLALSF